MSDPLNQDPQHFLECAFDRKFYTATATENLAVGLFDQRAHPWPYEAVQAHHTHFSCALFEHNTPETVRDFRRNKDRWTGAIGVVFDDIGEIKNGVLIKAPPVEPTAIIETKPGSCQYVYLFNEIERDRALIDTIQRSAIAGGMCDPGAGNITRITRLPGSLPPGKTHRAKLIWADWTRRFNSKVFIEKALQVARVEAPAPQEYAAPNLSDSTSEAGKGTLEAACHKIRNVGGVTGSDTINTQAFFVGQNVGAGLIALADAEAALFAAAYDRHPADGIRQAKNGLEAGILKPLARGELIGSTRPATYAVPTGSVAEARATIAEAFANWADKMDVQAMRIGTGIGKSRAARVTAVNMVRKLRAEGDKIRSVVIAVPRHDLGREYIAEMQDQGVIVRVWKGRSQPDDEQPGKMMCHRHKDAEIAQKSGADVSGTLCKNGETCCFALFKCGHQMQREAMADIWLVPHAMLWSVPPTAIKAAALIVDEDPTGDVFGGMDGPYRISLDDLKAPVPVLAAQINADLTYITSTIVQEMLTASEGQPIGKQTPFNLMEIAKTGHFIDSKLVNDVRGALYSVMITRPCRPNTQGKKFNAAMEKAGLRNRRILRIARFLKILDAAMMDGKGRVPGLTVETVKTPDGDTYKAARMRWRKDLHEGWQVPTMIMSATLDHDLLRHIWPDLDKVTIAEAAMPHVKVRQITDSANPKSGLLDRQEGGTFIPKGGRIKRLAQYAEARAHELGGKVLVVAQMDVIEALEQQGLPDSVETGHYNALSGLDGFKDVRGIIQIGRTLPSPAVVEMMREVLTGKAGVELPKWYHKAEAALNLDGTGHGPRVFSQAGHGGRITYGADRHPDPITEKLRWMICEGEVMQAIGRGRGVNRGPDNPLQVDILTHIPLPLVVDEAGPFAQFEPHPFDLMAARGVVVLDTSAKGAWGIVAAMLPDVFANVQAAKDAAKSSQWNNRSSIIYGYSTVRDGKLKLEGGRYAVSVKVAEGAKLPTGATFTETPSEPKSEPAPKPAPEPEFFQTRRLVWAEGNKTRKSAVIDWHLGTRLQRKMGSMLVNFGAMMSGNAPLQAMRI